MTNPTYDPDYLASVQPRHLRPERVSAPPGAGASWGGHAGCAAGARLPCPRIAGWCCAACLLSIKAARMRSTRALAVHPPRPMLAPQGYQKVAFKVRRLCVTAAWQRQPWARAATPARGARPPRRRLASWPARPLRAHAPHAVCARCRPSPHSTTHRGRRPHAPPRPAGHQHRARGV